MLTDDNDKYKMCPVFKHIIGKEPHIGDYALTTYGLLIIQDVFDEFDEYDNTTLRKVRTYNIYDMYAIYRDSSYEERISYINDSGIIISNELANILIKYIDYKSFHKISEIVISKADEHEEFKHVCYMFLYHLYTYLNSLITDDIDKMILLSFGIEKVLKKHKNNGFRDVLLGNGQVWRLKKRKAKGSLRKNIISTNRNIDKNQSRKKKIKTVHYTVIERLDKNEIIIS